MPLFTLSLSVCVYVIFYYNGLHGIHRRRPPPIRALLLVLRE